MAKQAKRPGDEQAPEGAILAVWVIYHRPKDYPDGYVLRCQYAMENLYILHAPTAWHADNIDALRAIVPPGLHRLERHPDDDPHIVETWI